MRKRPRWLAVLVAVVVLVPDLCGALIRAIILAFFPVIFLLFWSTAYGNWFTTTLAWLGFAAFVIVYMARAGIVSYGITSGALLGIERLLYVRRAPAPENDRNERNAT